MKIAIIAGSGDFPIKLQKKTQMLLFCVLKIIHFQVHLKIILKLSLKDPLSWISVLKKNKITHLVMAGKINRISNEKFHDNKFSHNLIKKHFSR